MVGGVLCMGLIQDYTSPTSPPLHFNGSLISKVLLYQELL